jgi:O-6-methylguanine DNA methyltransferase
MSFQNDHIDFDIKPGKVNLTKFQWKVLKVTATIPMGETRTYKWVAEKAGSPDAVRAVGQALRRNPYPLIIPCHRVVKSDGSLGGYAGGPPDKKRELLRIESEIIAHINTGKSKDQNHNIER